MLQQDLKNRFGFFLDENDLKYDPICLIAQALDPRYGLLLSPHEEAQVKYHLSTMVKILSEYAAQY